jgi:hypothetical protein
MKHVHRCRRPWRCEARFIVLRLLFGVSLLTLLLTTGLVAHAQSASSAPSTQSMTGGGAVDQFHGAFGTSVPIEVPPFRRIEPRLSLDCKSSGANSFAGGGGSLSGFVQEIDRASSVERRVVVTGGNA